MRTLSRSRLVTGAAVAAGCVLASSCVATSAARPQQFRTFLLPPSLASAAASSIQSMPEPPQLLAGTYSNETPNFGSQLTVIPRATDTEFILKRAEDRFAAGKKAVQNGRTEDARAEFDKAIEILLSAPEETAERPRLEKRLQEMVDAIYRYDAGELGASQPATSVASDGRPLEELLEMTFPVDPSLRNKVREQIQATVSQLPLDTNDAVVSYINYFSSPKGKQTLEAGLRRSGRYKPMIQRILAEEGLPQELIFLAQAESGFMPQAISYKACVGLWQFLGITGGEYGLHVSGSVDERMDPEKATRAAARLLRDLYAQEGDWYLAMAAYNCGPGCVDQRVARTGYADFWTLRRMNVLPKETANYVPLILAMIIVSKNAKDYGLDEIELDSPLVYDTVELESPTSLSLVAAAVDRPIAELKELNPALLRNIAPAGYEMRLPSGTQNHLEQAFAVIPAGQRDSWRLHRVESGDTALSLAKRYGTTVDMIASVNRGELPEAGLFAAIPMSYPQDHPAVKRVAAKTAAPASSPTASAKVAKPGSPSALTVKAPVKKPYVAQTPQQSPHKTPVRKPAIAPRTPGA